jgi:hypothetical protein
MWRNNDRMSKTTTRTIIVLAVLGFLVIGGFWLSSALSQQQRSDDKKPSMEGCYTPGCGVFKSEATQRAGTPQPAMGIVDPPKTRVP